MKNYLKYLRIHVLTLTIILCIGFLFSFFLADLINQNRSYYESTFVVDEIENFDDKLLIDEEFLNDIKSSNKNYENIDVEKMLSKNDFSYKINENEITIITKSKYYDTYFLKNSNAVFPRAKTFIKDIVTKIASGKCVVTFNDENIGTLKNIINRWWFALYGMIATLFVELIAAIFLMKLKTKNGEELATYKYNNETMFSSCFHKKYWKLAVRPLIKVKDITTIAMLFALMLVCKLIPLPSGFGNLGISFTYLFFAIISLIYGPVYGFIIGIFSDVIGYFLPTGGGGMFNFGYTLQAALTGMIYGLCFYKTKVSFSKVLFSRFLVNIFMNAIYGSFLYIFVAYFKTDPTMTFSRYLELVKYYFLLMSLPKNIVYLLPQSLLLYFVIKSVLPILVRFKLIEKEIIKS